MVNIMNPNLAAAVELIEAAKQLSFAAQITGGVAGRDENLQQAIERITPAIAEAIAELGRGAVPVIDLDAIAYERIKKSIDIAHEFLPEEVKPHYELNYWVADICNWLENRHSLAGADGWYLPKKPLNDLQIASVEEQIKRCKQAHFTDIDIRINGKFERRQADWIKHMQPILTRPPVAGLAEWLPIDLETVPKGKPVLVSGKYEGSEFWVYYVAEYYPENSLEIHESYPGQLDNDDVEYAPAGWYREATNDDEDCAELGFEPIYFQRIEKPTAKAAREFLGKVDG